jgi:flagellar capping protein FliD
MNLNTETEFKKIQQEAEKDLNINNQEYKDILNSLPHTYQKYLNHFYNFSIIYDKINKKLYKKYNELYRYYRDEFSIKLKTNELENYIKADDSYQEIEQILLNIKHQLNYLDNIMKQLNQISFYIKNAIDWEKFKNGII